MVTQKKTALIGAQDGNRLGNPIINPVKTAIN